LKTQRFGIEIEMTAITREKAAKVTADYLGGTVERTYNSYDCYNITAPDGRVWQIMSDASIKTMKRENGVLVSADNTYSAELVTPILKYDDDMETLQEVIR